MTATFAVSKEEQRALAQEGKMAKELGEPQRKSYLEGKAVGVPSPTFSCTAGGQCGN